MAVEEERQISERPPGQVLLEQSKVQERCCRQNREDVFSQGGGKHHSLLGNKTPFRTARV